MIQPITVSGSYSEGMKTTGNDAIVRFLMDSNHTMLDKGIKNAINSFMPTEFSDFKDFDEYALSKHNDLIIVHLRFMKPDMTILDTKYSTSDLTHFS